jgi:hypothetical protein
MENKLSLSTIRRYGLETALFVYDRANRKCETCGVDKDLTLHHIDHNGRNNLNKGLPQNNDKDNLIVLCRRCHGGLHGREGGHKGGRPIGSKSTRKTTELNRVKRVKTQRKYRPYDPAKYNPELNKKYRETAKNNNTDAYKKMVEYKSQYSKQRREHINKRRRELYIIKNGGKQNVTRIEPRASSDAHKYSDTNSNSFTTSNPEQIRNESN